jgi:hypothetical protein
MRRLEEIIMDERELSERIRKVFNPSQCNPPMSLRSGNSVDSCGEPLEWDLSDEAVDDAYLESYHWGLYHLDPESWRFYLPYFIDYALRHRGYGGSAATSTLLQNLRPPDRIPPRLASLSSGQEQLIIEFLEFLAYGEDSDCQDEALQVLEEYWMPDSLYRPEL